MNNQNGDFTNVNGETTPKKKGGCLKTAGWLFAGVIGFGLIVGSLGDDEAAKEAADPVVIEPAEKEEEKAEPVAAEPVVDQSSFSVAYSVEMVEVTGDLSEHLSAVSEVYVEMGTDPSLFMDEAYIENALATIEEFDLFLLGLDLSPETEADQDLHAMMAEYVKLQMLANDRGSVGIQNIDAEALTEGLDYQNRANDLINEMTAVILDAQK